MMADDKESERDFAAIVDRIAAAIGLDIAELHRPGVIDNFERIATLAPLVTAFLLEEEVEISQIFVP
jgi:1-carboxybiuret hydrolase subunit AtzG-like protein